MSSTSNKVAEAIFNRQFDEARTLLANGESFSGQYVENNKSQLFSNVIRHKAFDLVDAFIKEGLIETDIYEYDNFDRSFFRTIAKELKEDADSINFLRDFLSKIDNKNDEVQDQTLLGYFFETGAAPAVLKTLIEAGCAANHKDNAERNFLHVVTSNGMLQEAKGLAYMKILADEGVDMNDKDIEGKTPLMIAVGACNEAYISFLVQNGANPNEQNKDGNTVYYFAAVEQLDSKIFSLLCKHGSPDFDATNKDGESLFGEFMRIMHGESDEMKLLGIMLKNGASFTQTSLYYNKPKSGLDWLAEKNSSVLQFALKENAVDVDYRDDKGNTILHKVCGFDVRYEDDVARDLYKKVKLLLDAGADPSVTNDNDETPLMLAQEDNLKVKTVELLMKK